MKPTPLGSALIETYKRHSIDLWQPESRAQTEREIALIADGSKTIEEVLVRNITEFKTICDLTLAKRTELHDTFQSLCGELI